MTLMRIIGIANFVFMLLQLADGNYWGAFFNASVVALAAVDEWIDAGK